MNEIVIGDLTEATLAGEGTFDVLMRANKVHLDEEFSKNRIKGPDYASVYLGSLTTVMQLSLQFLLEKDQAALQTKLIEAQVKLAEQQAINAGFEGINLGLQSEVLRQQALNLAAERDNLVSQAAYQAQQILNLKQDVLQAVVQTELLELQKGQLAKEGLQTEAQTAFTNQQKQNLLTQDLQTLAQTEQIKGQTALVEQQVLNTKTENTTMLLQQTKLEKDTALVEQQLRNAEQDRLQGVAQTLLVGQQLVNAKTENATMLLQQGKLVKDTALTEQQVKNLTAEGVNIPKQGKLLDRQENLLTQQVINAEVESRVMEASLCKLKAEYDLIMEQKLKTVTEASLLAQKKVTEQAQTSGTGVDTESVIGKQKLLYAAQTDGFKRNAEHQAAKLMADTWNVRRTTDEGTSANSTNGLDDAAVGRVINKMVSGVGA